MIELVPSALLVEGNEDWRADFEKDLVLGFDVTTTPHLTDGMIRCEDTHFDIIVCAGTFTKPYDGREWVRRLQEAGKKTILVSVNPIDQVPSIDKRKFERGQLLALAQKMLMEAVSPS